MQTVDTIGKISLKNNGAFVVKLQFAYWDSDNVKHHVDGSDKIIAGKTQCLDPGQFGVPNGARVSLYAFVVWGNDNIANEVFTYQSGSPVTVNYVISGTTLSSTLATIGIDRGALSTAV